jgi:DNA-binding MarR family transcriptional regulator
MTPRSISEDIKQSRPFRSKGQEAAVALLRTANVLRRRFEALVQAEGITLQQYNVLRILRGARAPLPTMEIAERLVEDAPGITRLVNVLEERRLLRREQWAGDRRHVFCQISPAGTRLLEKLDGPMDTLDDATGDNLTENELDLLLDVLSRIRESASGDDQPASSSSTKRTAARKTATRKR